MADSKGKASSAQAKTGYGMRFYMGTGDDPATATWIKVEGMKSGSLPSPERPDIDVTTTEDKVKAYIKGTGDIPDMSLEFNFYPNNSVHQDIVKNVLYSEAVRPWKIAFGPENEATEEMSFAFLGYLKSATPTFGVDAAMTMPLTLKATTQPIPQFGSTTGSLEYTSTLAGNKSTGSVTGSVAATLSIDGGATASFNDTVSNGSKFTLNTHYTVSNVPTGLTAVLTKTSATLATLTFTGTATTTTDVNNIVLTFLGEAFTGVTASNVVGATKTDIAITFA